MSSKAFLLLFARMLMSSLFVWDGVVQLRNPGGTARYYRRAPRTLLSSNGVSANESRFLLRKTF
jgi:hypothetical protein